MTYHEFAGVLMQC